MEHRADAAKNASRLCRVDLGSFRQLSGVGPNTSAESWFCCIVFTTGLPGEMVLHLC